MKVSIITVCRNSVKTIEETIRSVLEQTHGDIEYIVIDGLSTDGTIDIINRSRQGIALFMSEADKGIYNAMNKGLQYSKGDIVYFLNSDDRLYGRNTVKKMVDTFRDTKALLLYGDVMIMQGGTYTLKRHHEVSRKYFLHNTICQQGIFARKTLFNAVGPFNEKYCIYADLDWLLRAYSAYPASMVHVQEIICYYSYEGVSSTAFFHEKYIDERREVLSNYFLKAKAGLCLRGLARKWGLHC